MKYNRPDIDVLYDHRQNSFVYFHYKSCSYTWQVQVKLTRIIHGTVVNTAYAIVFVSCILFFYLQMTESAVQLVPIWQVLQSRILKSYQQNDFTKH